MPLVLPRRRFIQGMAAAAAIPSHLAGNAVDEQYLGELPEDLMSERLIRNPILSPKLISGQTHPLPTIIGPGGALQSNTQRYKSSVVPFVANLASAKALPANGARAYLLVQNNCGTGDSIAVNFGADANPANAIIVIDGGNLIFEGGGPGGSFVPQEDVYIVAVTTGGLACVVMEGLNYTP